MNDGHYCVPSAFAITLMEQPYYNHESRSNNIKNGGAEKQKPGFFILPLHRYTSCSLRHSKHPVT